MLVYMLDNVVPHDWLEQLRPGYIKN